MRVGWTITFEGKAWTESDLSLADASRALEITGGSWTDLHPLTSPDHFAALLACLLAGAGEDFDAALARVSILPMVDALAMVSAGEE